MLQKIWILSYPKQIKSEALIIKLDSENFYEILLNLIINIFCHLHTNSNLFWLL